MITSLTPNRISTAIENVEAAMLAQTEAWRTEIDKTLALEGDDHFRFQTLQSQAHAMGNLSTDEAQLVYLALGEIGSAANGGWAARTDTATKFVVTQLMGELLAKKLA